VTRREFNSRQAKFRVTVIARIRRGVARQEIMALVASVLAEKGLSAEDTSRWVSLPANDTGKQYVKISVRVSAEELDDAWNLKVSRQFSHAGCGEVAWKITPVADDDADGEDTTCSIPEDLFRLEDDPAAAPKNASGTPPEPFGSDPFWDWFADNEACLGIEQESDGRARMPEDPRGPAKVREGVRIICAACHRIRKADGRWEVATTPAGRVLEGDVSHGICPQCAQKLYPDLYPE
jgi:hypothetical protein